MADKKTEKAEHNDLDDLPEQEALESYDETDPDEVFSGPEPEVEEEEPAKADDKPETKEEEPQEADDDKTAEAVESGEVIEPEKDAEEEESEKEVAEEAEEAQLTEAVTFGAGAEAFQFDCTPDEAKILRALQETAGQLAPLQKTHATKMHAYEDRITALEQATAPAAEDGSPFDVKAVDAVLQALPNVSKQYAPVLEHIANSLPNDHEIKDFVQRDPMVASLILSLFDGQRYQAADTRRAVATEQTNAFKTHVDGVYKYVAEQAGGEYEQLLDQETRDSFDVYLQTVAPVQVVRSILASEQSAAWTRDRFSDFMARKATAEAIKLADEAEAGEKPSAAATGAAKRKRRASRRGGGTARKTAAHRSGQRFDADIEGVLDAS